MRRPRRSLRYHEEGLDRSGPHIGDLVSLPTTSEVGIRQVHRCQRCEDRFLMVWPPRRVVHEDEQVVPICAECVQRIIENGGREGGVFIP
jgi:hypothetical protein